MDQGTVVIGVRMRLDQPLDPSPAAFVPENPSSCSLIQRLFMDENTADVLFEVDAKGEKRGATKKAKASPSHFHAHRLILRQCAPQLAELCGETGEGGTTSVAITGVAPDNFRRLLSYLYGFKIPEAEMEANAKDLIDAADKYAISGLKLEAEACFVKSTKIGPDNVTEHLLYADAVNCALLKEAAMNVALEHKVEILDKGGLRGAPEGLLNDVLAAVARRDLLMQHYRRGRDDARLSILGVSDLRRKAHEKGLDVDGSREALISALEEKSRQEGEVASDAESSRSESSRSESLHSGASDSE